MTSTVLFKSIIPCLFILIFFAFRTTTKNSHQYLNENIDDELKHRQLRINLLSRISSKSGSSSNQPVLDEAIGFIQTLSSGYNKWFTSRCDTQLISHLKEEYGFDEETYSHQQSPQYKAFQWILDDIELKGTSFFLCQVSYQRYVMSLLYFSLQEPVNYTIRHEQHECDWFPQITSAVESATIQVGCNFLRIVQSLQISNIFSNNPSNETYYIELPTETTNLSELQKLEINNTDIGGPIPLALGALASLRELVLYNNKFASRIPEQLSTLKSLINLDLRFNFLEDQVPESICNQQANGPLDSIKVDCTMPCKCCTETTCETLTIYNDLASIVDEKASLSNSLWERVQKCMMKQSTNDTDIASLLDVAWQGFLEYSSTNGTEIDPWSREQQWLEWDPKSFTYMNGSESIEVVVNEPCNAISNFAYLRSMLAMCEYTDWSINEKTIRSKSRNFAFLAFGSSFYHASQTKLGQTLDSMAIRISAFEAYQSTVEPLGYNPFVSDLRSTRRPFNSLQASENIANMILNETVYNWKTTMDKMDLPSYTVTFIAMGNVLSNLVLNPKLALKITKLLVIAFDQKQHLNFLETIFHPALVKSLTSKKVNPSVTTRFNLLASSAGTLVKIIYAFVWQEDTIDGPHLTSSVLKLLGQGITPLINTFANNLMGLKSNNFQGNGEMYPGDATCNTQQPHAKWHEQSTNGLTSLMILMDDARKVILGSELQREETFNITKCGKENNCFSDFDFSNVTNVHNDTLLNVLEECVPLLFDDYPNTPIEKVSNCAMSLIRQRYVQEPSTNAVAVVSQNEIETLDYCLIVNDCVSFALLGIVDKDRIESCIYSNSTTPSTAPCQKYVHNPPEAKSCIEGCFGSPVCTSGCLEIYGDFSPTISRAISCLMVFVDRNNPNYGTFLQNCMARPTEVNEQSQSQPTMFRSIVAGLPKVVSCMTGTCSLVSAKVRLMTSTLWQCTEDCNQSSDENPFPFIKLPRTIACLSSCWFIQKVNSIFE